MVTARQEFIVYHKPRDRAAYMCPFGQQPPNVHIVTVGSESHCLRYMILSPRPLNRPSNTPAKPLQ